MSEGAFWEDYWAEEEAAWCLERDEAREMENQSRQIQYEADYRRGFPLGKYSPPLHANDLKRSR